MSIEQYYQHLKDLNPPADMQWTEMRDFYANAKKELKKKLSDADLKQVEAQERNFAKRMQSSIG